jgi:hypothetical protein
MYYLPYNTYKNISPIDLRYDALLCELAAQSKEVQKLRERAASFSNSESAVAKRKLKKIATTIMSLRDSGSV